MLHIPLKPMLLHKSDTVPIGNYIHQLKYDGFRCLLSFDGNDIKLFTRHENEYTSQFPEMQNIRLNANNVVLDGEMISLDESGKPCFESIMSRFQSKSRNPNIPVHFIAFDVLYLNGKEAMHLPLERRLELLHEIVISSNEISVCVTSSDGEAFFQKVKKLDLEGIVSKKSGSKYHLNHRSRDWLKVKNYQYEFVQIAGIRKEEFGWSLVKDGKYVGVMEFVPPNPKKAFGMISQQLVTHHDNQWTYLDPIVKCRVKFQCYTKRGLMRSPSFVEFIL